MVYCLRAVVLIEDVMVLRLFLALSLPISEGVGCKGERVTPSHVHIVFKNAEVIDGTGAESVLADVAVVDKKIVAIDSGLDCSADMVIDCDGLTLAPGFIDTHTHDDHALLDASGLACKISQGITSVVIGNCGISLAPAPQTVEKMPYPFHLIANNGGDFFESAKSYYDRLKASPPAVNYASLIGHSALRLSAGVDPDRKAKESEISHMERQLNKALSEGAKGLSLGLEYPAACAADEREIEPLLATLKQHNALLTAHLRTESEAIISAIDEVASLAEQAHVPLVISHHKCSGKHNFGRSTETLPLIENLSKNQQIVFDAYPYTVGMTVLLYKFVKICDKTVIASSLPHPELEGKDIYEVARSFQDSIENAIRYVSPATAFYYIMDEEDVRRILAHPLGMIGSDGLHDQSPHPRLWGTFPRFFGHYVRDLGILRWEEAVRKTTSLPAQTFGLSKRGQISKGFFADMVIFDKAKIKDGATFENPTKNAEGIVNVFVNGALVWRQGQETGQRSGERL